MAHDLVIRNGLLADGTGAPLREADLAVTGGRVVEVGTVGRPGPGGDRRRRGAGGPGLGRHPHPLRRPGDVGPAPVPVVQQRRDHRRVRQLRRRVRPRPPGGPGPAHPPHGGRGGHPRHRPARGPAVDVDHASPSTSTPSSAPRTTSTAPPTSPTPPLRVHAMGERARADETATDDEIAAMAALAREAVAAGAVGFSTSRSLNHRSSTGEKTPEPHRLGRRAGRHRRRAWPAPAGASCSSCRTSSTSTRNGPCCGTWWRCRGGRCRSPSPSCPSGPTTTTPSWTGSPPPTPKACGSPPRWPPARSGSCSGCRCTLHPFMTNPVYAEIADRPLDEQVAALRTPAFRRRLLARPHR